MFEAATMEEFEGQQTLILVDPTPAVHPEGQTHDIVKVPELLIIDPTYP